MLQTWCHLAALRTQLHNILGACPMPCEPHSNPRSNRPWQLHTQRASPGEFDPSLAAPLSILEVILATSSSNSLFLASVLANCSSQYDFSVASSLASRSSLASMSSMRPFTFAKGSPLDEPNLRTVTMRDANC